MNEYKFCTECKWAVQSGTEWKWNGCSHIDVMASHDLAIKKKVNCDIERKKLWPFGKCGKRGALWEPKSYD